MNEQANSGKFSTRSSANTLEGVKALDEVLVQLCVSDRLLNIEWNAGLSIIWRYAKLEVNNALLWAFFKSCIPVDIMPGEFDPSNHIMPQQPLHPCMFPKGFQFSSLRSVTNPYEFSIDGVRYDKYAF